MVRRVNLELWCVSQIEGKKKKRKKKGKTYREGLAPERDECVRPLESGLYFVARFGSISCLSFPSLLQQQCPIWLNEMMEMFYICAVWHVVATTDFTSVTQVVMLINSHLHSYILLVAIILDRMCVEKQRSG